MPYTDAQTELILRRLQDAMPTETGLSTALIRLTQLETQMTTVARQSMTVFNLRSYGAVGNGVADDTAAIDAVLAAAEAAGGGTVFCPRGSYLTTGGHDVPPRTTVMGVGPYGTTFLMRGATWCFRLMDSGSPSYGPHLTDLSIEGSTASLAAVSGGIGIEISNGLFSQVSRCAVQSFTSSGIGIRFHNINLSPVDFTEQTLIDHTLITNCTRLMQFTADSGAGQSFGYTQLREIEFQMYEDQIAIDVGGTGPTTCLLYNSRIQGQMHYTGDDSVGINVTDYGAVYQGTTIDIAGEFLGAYTGCKRIQVGTGGEFQARGRFFAATGTLTDTYSGATSYQFVEPELSTLELPAANIASASSISVPAGRDFWNVTGTTTINNIAAQTSWEGRRITLKFAGALTVTHNASAIALSNAANMTTAAGDTLTLGYAGTVWYELARTTTPAAERATLGLVIGTDVPAYDGPTTYTPALTGTGSNPNLGSTGTAVGRYVQIGAYLHVQVQITFGGTGITAGSGDYRVSLPVSADASADIMGGGRIYDSSTQILRMVSAAAVASPTSTVQLLYPDLTTGVITSMSATAPAAPAAGDQIILSLSYLTP